jgi:hypothetical protein
VRGGAAVRWRSGVAACVAVLAAPGCQKPSNGPPAECAACTWQRLALHPEAAAQPTATGKALMALVPWRGRLYIGYGDYQANTGPIDITVWDPALGRFVTVHTSDTEAIYNYRAIGNSLWAPATDRRTRADYAVGEPWRDERPVTVAHAYDIATLDGRDLWLVGSAEGGAYPATAWRSRDGGASWSVGRESAGTGRYYFAAVYHQQLYLENWWERPLGPSEVFDGAQWTAGPELLPAGGHGFRPMVFSDRLVYAAKQTLETPHAELSATPNRLLAFDGQAARVVLDRELLDFFVDEREVMVLDTAGAIWRTTDLARWSRLVSAAELHPRSIAILDGALYVGTRDAQLYRLVGWP